MRKFLFFFAQSLALAQVAADKKGIFYLRTRRNEGNLSASTVVEWLRKFIEAARANPNLPYTDPFEKWEAQQPGTLNAAGSGTRKAAPSLRDP